MGPDHGAPPPRRRSHGAEAATLRALMGLRPPRQACTRWLTVTGMLFAIGVVHHVGGRNIGLYTFFVLPCAYAGWALGRCSGLVVAVASAAIVLASDFMTHLGAPAAELATNALLRAVLYVLIASGTDTIGRLIHRLHEQSRTDALTGMANRREFLARGEAELARARRSKRPFSVLFIDIDNFKAVNDTLGHAEGDALLRRVGRLTTSMVRSVDTAARLGGDEFALLLPETDRAGARRIAEKLHRGMKEELDGTGLRVSASIGAAAFPAAPSTFDDALKFADELMYTIKRGSKDAVMVEDYAGPSADQHEYR